MTAQMHIAQDQGVAKQPHAATSHPEFPRAVGTLKVSKCPIWIGARSLEATAQGSRIRTVRTNDGKGPEGVIVMACCRQV
jgi:hypothetical protein